ncbi:MAG: hypothetical protein K9H58_16385 [Bacteroidales bacterium]|nr:hypothetical protein [Bacteroidales bacterium]
MKKKCLLIDKISLILLFLFIASSNISIGQDTTSYPKVNNKIKRLDTILNISNKKVFSYYLQFENRIQVLSQNQMCDISENGNLSAIRSLFIDGDTTSKVEIYNNLGEIVSVFNCPKNTPPGVLVSNNSSFILYGPTQIQYDGNDWVPNIFHVFNNKGEELIEKKIGPTFSYNFSESGNVFCLLHCETGKTISSLTLLIIDNLNGIPKINSFSIDQCEAWPPLFSIPLIIYENKNQISIKTYNIFSPNSINSTKTTLIYNYEGVLIKEIKGW